MGERAMINRIRKLKEIEQQQAALEAEAERIREEIKTEMATKGKSEIKAGDFVVRFKKVITNRFDSKSFQQEHKHLYESYIRQRSYQRFTIA